MTEEELKMYEKKIKKVQSQLNENKENVGEEASQSIINYTNSVEDPLSPNFDQDKNPWTKQPKKKGSGCGIL
ncbi:guanine nucleotide-binding protein subunit gamma [Anaeramoeba flamelloides]|uniref:Guanine nucleotide-binding protein subunit gamma n=1 Tax=Anaeramoeba flamelloides TaxID=1746091 RepID=A0AAV7YDC7_9EUKA|nr:guanine nucleotide-binding protein subunit gamma [Anaeramoeba flamelloides]KAJ6243207.1 guanine nucleotide-binding protein subunit gamma [Anaeramoeba flamelloides]